MKPRRAAVLGLGNVLMGDDGFGPYLAQLLQAAYEIPEGLSVRELGTPGFGSLAAVVTRSRRGVVVHGPGPGFLVTAKGPSGRAKRGPDPYAAAPDALSLVGR